MIFMLSKYVYLIQNQETGDYKIGISKSPVKRIEQLSTGSSSGIKLVDTYQSEYAHKIETTLHNRFSYLRRNGEWFYLSVIDVLNFIDYCVEIEKNIYLLKKYRNPFI